MKEDTTQPISYIYKKIIRKYYSYVNQLDNLEKIDKFLET